MALMQHEALLLAQAFYKDGTASFDGVSRSMTGHPATAGRHALFSPAACAQHYRNLFAAEGVDSSQLPADMRQPQSRTHLKLIRKYYYLREVEARERLCRQEEQMRVLSRELSELDQGLWDARLTNSYILIDPSPDPSLARYAHINSAVASAYKTQVPSEIPSRQGNTDMSSGPDDRHVGTTHPGRAMLEIADKTTGEAWTARNPVGGVSSDRNAPADQLEHIPEVSEEEGTGNVSQLKPGDADIATHPPETVGRHRGAERRQSNRPSRSTPLDAQEWLESNASQLREHETLEGSSAATPNDAVSSNTAVFETEESEEPKRHGKGRRRSSVPREANKRRRTETPQARGQSPALSDVSRTKRVKTEEMDSSVSTPVADHERTPFSGSDPGSSRRFRNTAPHLISQLQGSVYSTYFKEPVKEGEAVNYFEIVKRPMDLKTLLQHIKAGRVASKTEFTRDIYLIFANAIMYNGADNYVGQDATALFKEAQGLLQVLEQAENRLL